MIPVGLQWLLTRKGLGATSHLEAGGFVRSKEGVPHPNIEFYFLPVAVKDHGRIPMDQHAYQVYLPYVQHRVGFSGCTWPRDTIEIRRTFEGCALFNIFRILYISIRTCIFLRHKIKMFAIG
jgi:hypothetical protein